MASNNQIAALRRYFGYAQSDFAEFAQMTQPTYSVRERNSGQFRLKELANIADKLDADQRLMLAGAMVEIVFGTGMEVKITK